MQDLSGKRLGQYELRERLGRGGMAEVYKAYQPGMDRYVAIKVMLGHLANDGEFVERFRREAQAVGRLRHPHIVQVFDFGVTEDVYYMAMEFIEGETLKAHIIKQKKLDPDAALRITIQLAGALDYAHGAGMIHRDLKPANIMFIDKGNTHSILTDFGIARILGQAGLTASGAMVGTPAYISPEAARGEATDARSDLYGLGVILYEMLTGRVPYDADTPLATVLKHMNAPLPTRQDYGDDIPSAVERVILKSLTKDPNDRYQTAADMKFAVEQALVDLQSTSPTKVSPAQLKSAEPAVPPTQKAALPDEPTQQLTAPPAAMTKTAARRSRMPFYAGGVLLAVIIIAALALLLGGGDEDDLEPTPVTPFIIAAATDAETTDEPTVELTDAPTNVTSTNLPTDLPTDVFTNEPTDAPTNEPTDAPTGEPSAVPTDELTPVPTEVAQQRIPGSVSLIRDISPLSNQIDEMVLAGAADAVDEVLDRELAAEPDNADKLIDQSLWYSTQDEGEPALEAAQRALELAPDNPMALIALGEALTTYPNNDPDGAAAAIMRASELAPANPHVLWRLAAVRSEFQNDDLGATRTLFEAQQRGASGYDFARYAGEFLFEMGRYPDALPYLQALVNSTFDDDYYRLYLMGALIQMEQQAEAYALAQETAQGLSDPFFLGNLAYVAYRAGEYAQARQWAETAHALSTDAPQATYVLALVAGFAENNPEESIALFESLPEDWFETWPMLTPYFGHDRGLDMARVWMHNENPENALEIYNGLLEDNPWWPEAYMERANAHLALEQREPALDDLRQGYYNVDAQSDPEFALLFQRRIYELFWGEDYRNMLPEPGRVLTEADLTIDPISGLSEIHNEVERLLLMNNDEVAFELTDERLRANPQDSTVMAVRVYIWLYLGDGEQALAEARAAIEADPDNIIGHLALIDAALHWSVEDNELASETLQQLIRNEDNLQNPAVVSRLAIVRRSMGRPDQAREAFIRAAELNAQGLIHAWASGSFWLDQAQSREELESALEPLKTVFVSSNGIYERTQYIAALIFTGRDQEAFNAAAQIAPDIINEPYYYDLLAFAAYRANVPEQARAWARMKIALDPAQSNDARYIDGLISWHVDGDLEAALETFNLVIENREQSGMLIFNRRLRTNIGVDSAQVLVEMGRLDEAMERYNLVIENIDDYGPAYEGRADLFLLLDDREAARADLQRALELTQDPDERQRLVDRIVALGPAGSDG